MNFEKLKNFTSNPLEFSFKDLLATTFAGFFFYVGLVAIKENSTMALDVLKTLVSLVGIILGGYFGHEAIQLWKQYSVNQKDQRKGDV